MAAAALVLPAAALRLPAAAFTAAGDGTPPFSRPFVRLGGGTSGCLASANWHGDGHRRQDRGHTIATVISDPDGLWTGVQVAKYDS